MKFWGEIHALLWTIGASIITIGTLSGFTQQLAIWVTVGTLVLHLAGALKKKEDQQ
jgi:hypothetical protein